MSEGWLQTITVSSLDDEDGFILYCELEGAEQEFLPGDVATLTFTLSKPHGFKFSRVSAGLVLCRLGDSEVFIDDNRGRHLRW